MSPDRWRQISEVYHAALTREGSKRTAFVREACAGDETLEREVESLLAQASAAIGFLTTPAATMVRSALSDSLAPGQQFGPYRIERLVGRGGMGEVYEAEHLEHGRRIALKVLSQRLNDPADRARFLREGQLAASVSHPHTVYIYSSEEIAGMPAIAMELLPGGTLKDRVEKTGPLAPARAIDATLQIVSGLEAAHAAGILHRDIKPSNCFVDADGTVKIGDFGLSIPTRARDATQLTLTGTVQGTPQFASPEQLRGHSLDVRSDIYSVGATLYYLLTGRPPFDDRDLMVLVSRIATEAPPSPRETRPEIPRALSALILECLAKDPADRPASYRVLSNVLEPLGSTVKTPAPLGIRWTAGLFDWFLSVFLLTWPVVLVAVPSSAFDIRHVLMHLVEVAYFAITESVWGASPGKALCGARVVTESGARPRFGRALLRALVFVVPAWFVSSLVLWMAGLVYAQSVNVPLVLLVEQVVIGLLFVPARRANGFAAVHEWVSRTRTVLTSPVARRLPGAVSTPREVMASQSYVGPYRLVDGTGSQPNCGATLGYDERLRRSVWLRFADIGSEPVPLARRIVGRSARPRWLAGQRTIEAAWDAYERVDGQPVDQVATRAQPWGTVRGWLRDLAEELRAGLNDGTLPPLELDRVWIGDDGRARLLDWSLCDGRQDAGGSPSARATDLPQAQRFLHRVAMLALEGRVLADSNSRDRATRVPLPMPAVDFLAKLGEQRFTTPEDMLTGAISAARGPAAVSRTKRAVHLVLCAILPIIVLANTVVAVYRQTSVPPRQDIAQPEIAELAFCLNWLANLKDLGVPSTGLRHRALEVYIAGRHRELISNPSTWSAPDLAEREFSDQRRALAERVIATWPDPRESDVADAARTLKPYLDNVRAGRQPFPRSWGGIWQQLWLYTLLGLMVVGIVGLISAVAGRGGIALRLMNIAIVTKNGAVASGSRARIRSALSWFPLLAASVALCAGHLPLVTLTSPISNSVAYRVLVLPPIFVPDDASMLFVRGGIATAALTVFALAAIVGVVRPQRGLQDRLAGTWLVPR
jgi:uncharacterized RDD family membrane protein YckC